jgi:myo-inositol-1(or 4)-monophosphatase
MQEKQSSLLNFAIQLAKESAQILIRMQKKARIQMYKGTTGDFALDADVTSEKHIMKRIRQKYPGHDILTEETGHHHQDSDYLWIIDPLEGTLNYAHHLPIWAVNIGLFYKGQPYIGAVYAPILKEFFHAAKGKGAYMNGKKIRVNKDPNIMKSFYAVGTPFIGESPISKTLIRGIGCAGVELAYVACGRFGAKIKLRGNDPFGYGAGSILVLEAGGRITDMNGKQWTLKSNGALASNGKLHEKLLEIINNTSS